MRVPYHLGSSNNFSLSYVSLSRDDALSRCNRDDVFLSFSLEQPVYCVFSAGDREEQPASEVRVTHPIVRAFVHVFRGVVDGQATIDGNKEPALEELSSVLGGSVDWSSSVSHTASQLLSELITRHTLPNSNHRSSIGLCLLYFDACGVCVEPDDIPRSVYNNYIRESKRILTVRRNTTPFRILEEAGCDIVRRKNEVDIHLNEYDLSVEDPHSHYYEVHEQASLAFIRRVGEVVGVDVSQEGVGFQSFRDQLAAE